MSEHVTVAAAVRIARPRLQTYLRAPVVPASTWPAHDWAGVCGSWDDGGTRSGYREELADAIRACDGWLDGDHAGLLAGLDEDGEPALGYDEATGSLTVDFDARVDFRLPSAIWALTVLRGMAGFMADDDTGLVTLTTDWSGEPVLLRLGPDRSSFLAADRDARELARARDAEFDVRCAAGEAVRYGSAAEAVEHLLSP